MPDAPDTSARPSGELSPDAKSHTFRMPLHCRLLVMPVLLMAAAGCSHAGRPDTSAIACKVAVPPTTACVKVDGKAAVKEELRDGPAYVLVLPGRSVPGAAERQCTRLGVRLVAAKGDAQLLPLVADATENTFHVTCGIP